MTALSLRYRSNRWPSSAPHAERDAEQGLILKSGTIVDAALIAAPQLRGKLSGFLIATLTDGE